MPEMAHDLYKVLHVYSIPVADSEGGSGGLLEPPFQSKLFHFRGEF